MTQFQKRNAVTIIKKKNSYLLVNTITKIKIVFSQKIKIINDTRFKHCLESL